MSQVVTLEGFRPPDRFDDVAWTQARIEESESQTGLFTIIDTLDLSPVDTDPTQPQLRSFTTSEGSDEGLWYRIVFLDDVGGVSLPSDPVQNTAEQAATAFAAASDLAARLGLTLTDEEEARALILLALASGLIRRATRQTITLVSDDTLTVRGNYQSRIILPQRPVVDVSAITQNGVALADGSWYVDGSDLVRGRLTGGSWDDPWSYGGASWSFWGCPFDSFEITYSHGYADVPDEVRATVLEMVARIFVNPAVTTRETNGSSDVMYAPTNGLLLTDTERRTVTDALRRQAATIALR